MSLARQTRLVGMPCCAPSRPLERRRLSNTTRSPCSQWLSQPRPVSLRSRSISRGSRGICTVAGNPGGRSGGGDGGHGSGGGGGDGGQEEEPEDDDGGHDFLMALKLAIAFLGPALVLAVLAMQVDAESRTWFGARGLFASPLDGRTVPVIPVLCTTAVAASVLFINRFLGIPFKVSSSILGFIAFPLGLFQGFRFNNMYNNRFGKAKSSMSALKNNIVSMYTIPRHARRGHIMSILLEIAHYAVLPGYDSIVLLGAGHHLTKRIVGLLEAFALEAGISIAGSGADDHGQDHSDGLLPHTHGKLDLSWHPCLDELMHPDDIKGLRAAKFKIDFLAGEILRCIHEARVKGLVDETEAQCLRGKLSAAKDGLGGCLSVEKGATPSMVPIHLRTLLLVYCSALPCTTYGSLGIPDYMFVPVHLFINYAILGIESCARLLEAPFGAVDCADGHSTYVIDAHAELSGARTRLRQLFFAADGSYEY